MNYKGFTNFPRNLLLYNLSCLGSSFSCQIVRSSHRDSFRKYLFFFSRSNLFIIFQECQIVLRTDMNFPGGSICSSNRNEFSRRVYMFFEQTQIFQEGLSKRHVFSRRFYLFVEQTLLSRRKDINFPRNPDFVLEHTRIFQEPLFSHRTDTHFPGKPYLVLEHIQFSRSPLCLEHISIFQEGTPSRTDISLIGLGGCFRIVLALGSEILNTSFSLPPKSMFMRWCCRKVV